MEYDYTSIIVVLTLLAGVGAPYFAGKTASYLAENWPKWHTFPKEVKFLSPLVLSVVISIAATFLLKQTALIETIGPYWTMVAQAVMMYLGTQEGYMKARSSGYALSAKLPPQG